MSMQQLPAYLGLWLVNTLLIYFTTIVAPEAVVVGNESLSPLAAALISGLLLTIVVIFTRPAAKLLGVKVKREEHWAVVFWGVNTLTIWVIARAAIYTGFGIAGFWWAIILGLFTTLLQWGVWKVSLAKKAK